MAFLKKLFVWLGSGGEEIRSNSPNSLDKHLTNLATAEAETNLALSKVLSFGTKMATLAEKMSELSVQVNELASFLLEENTLRAAKEVGKPKPPPPPPVATDKVRCLICLEQGIIVERHVLRRHLERVHNIGVTPYIQRYPGAKVVSETRRARAAANFRKTQKRLAAI